MLFPTICATISRTGKKILKHAVLGTTAKLADWAHLEDDRVAVCAIQLPGAR